MPSYHLSIETPTPLILGVGVIFAPVPCCDFCAFESAAQWERFVRRVLALRKTSSRPSGSVPSAPSTSPLAETSSGVSLPGTSSSSSLPLGGQGKREGSQGAPGVCLGGLPPLPLDLGRAGGVAVPLVFCLGRSRFSFSFGSGQGGGCPLAVGFLFSALPTSLCLPNSTRTFHDVRIRGRLRSLATAYYPPVVLVLRIVKLGRIRGPGHVGVARGCRCGCRSRSSSRSRSRGRGRRLQLSSAWLSSRARSCRVRSRSSDRYRTWRGAVSLDPWIDTGHTVTGGGLLTAPGCVISLRFFPARWGDRRDR